MRRVVLIRTFLIVAAIVFGSGSLLLPQAAPAERTPDQRLAAARDLLEKQPDQAISEIDRLLSASEGLSPIQRMEAWIILANAHNNSAKHETALAWAQKALDLARQNHAVEKEVLARYAMINVYRNQGKLDEEIRLGQETLNQAERSADPRLIMTLANSLGASYTRKGQYDLAIECFQKALDHAVAGGDTDAQTKMINNLSSLLIAVKDFDRALPVMKQGIDLAEKTGNKANMATLLSNQSAILDELGRKDEQLSSLNRALILARESGSQKVEGTVLTNLADLYLEEGDYPRAAELAQQGLKIAENSGDLYQSYVSKVTYAQAISHLGRSAQAIAIFQEALTGFQQAGMEAEVIEVTGIMSAAYEQAGQTAKALAHFKLFKEKSDALFQSEKIKTVAELQEKYESEQKQREIELLSKENQLQAVQLQRRQDQRNIILFVAVSLVLICLLVFQRYRMIRKTNKKLQLMNVRLNELSLRDSLTGLYNRRFFFSHIDSHAAYSKRNIDRLGGVPAQLAFLIIDIDNFKTINDRYGHHVGDLVLKEFAARLAPVLRESDILVRWGGEEFLLLGRDVHFEGAGQLAQRVLSSIDRQMLTIERDERNITCSVGYCCFPFAGEDTQVINWEKAVQIADHCLYKAKAAGRNRAIGAQAASSPMSVEDQQRIVEDFEQACEQGLIRLV